MAVLVIADVQGQTAEGYDGMLAALEAGAEGSAGLHRARRRPVGRRLEDVRGVGVAERGDALLRRLRAPAAARRRDAEADDRRAATRSSSARWRRCCRRATSTPTCRACRAWSRSPIVGRAARVGVGAAGIRAQCRDRIDAGGAARRQPRRDQRGDDQRRASSRRSSRIARPDVEQLALEEAARGQRPGDAGRGRRRHRSSDSRRNIATTLPRVAPRPCRTPISGVRRATP